MKQIEKKEPKKKQGTRRCRDTHTLAHRKII